MREPADSRSDFFGLTLFNLEGIPVPSTCTLKTEQKRRQSKATEGRTRVRCKQKEDFLRVYNFVRNLLSLHNSTAIAE